MKNVRSVPAFAFAFFLCCMSAGAQEPTEIVQQDGARKYLEIFRTQTAPVIDGVLNDEVWNSATVITDLHQFQPVDQGTPTEQSVFYISYDDNYFYVGARLYDSNPSQIIARQMIQGQGFGSDDFFEVLLDTF